MMKRAILAGLMAWTVACLAAAARPNVLFISVDDWNDWVGAYGGNQAKTPNLDRLAARGTVFRNAHTNAVYCAPSRTSLMTGLQPFTTGCHDAKPQFPVAIKIKSANKDESGEDRIELVTLLTAPAECLLNGRSLGVVPAGLQTRSIPSAPGTVRVEVIRSGRKVIAFETPKGITENPGRTDRLTYSYSSAYDREFRALFGGAGSQSSSRR